MEMLDELSEKNKEVLKKIKELKDMLPSWWVDVIAKKMGKSKWSVHKYATGEVGMRKGYHKEVLRYLKQLVESQNEGINKLLD